MKPRYLGKQNSFSNNSSLDKISRKESRKDFNEFESYGMPMNFLIYLVVSQKLLYWRFQFPQTQNIRLNLNQ